MTFLKNIIIWLLTVESRLILAKYKPFIVAVTGSVGKTSTKDAIYDVLKSTSEYARKSEKSLNSEIGLPLTIIGVPNAWRSISGWLGNLVEGLKLIIRKSDYPDTLILEIGADHPGDIIDVAKWLSVDIAVITQISDTPVHVEFFASPNEVFEEKASLVRAIKPGGSLVLFSDNEKVMSISGRVADSDIKVISFGTSEKSSIKGSDEHAVYVDDRLSGFEFTATVDGVDYSIRLDGVIGRTYMLSPLAALAVGKIRGVSVRDMVDRLSCLEAPKGRMNIIDGINGSILVDDTYNSSPDAVLMAIRTIKGINTNGVRIAVLGDMMELGQYATDEHRRIGREACNVFSMLVTVGQRSRAMAEEAVTAGMPIANVHSFDTAIEAGEYLKPLIRNGDIVLIKGSQSVRMERAVKLLMSDPDQAENLLVRQEKEWLER